VAASAIVAAFLSRMQTNGIVRLAFWIAVGLHAFEAVVAWRRSAAHKHNLKVRLLWALQTLVLGFPSLSLLPSKKSDTKTH
jgi:hypothetical protein